MQQAVKPGADEAARREQTLIRLMDAYRTELMRLSYLYLGDRALSEDAVQETFLKAYRHLDAFRGASSEKTWLTRIAINTCRDLRRSAWLRQMRRTIPLDQAPPQGAPDPYRDDTVLQAVLRLPPRDRQVIVLRYYQEMKVAQVAEVLGISEASAASRLKRARDRLARTLKGWYFDEE